MRRLKDLMDLRGRAALVTGGGGHLGRAIGATLAELGAAVALLDVSSEACEAAREEIGSSSDVDVTSLTVDLADEAALLGVPDTVVSRLGGLDILVNNAAFTGSSELPGWAVPFGQQSSETWRAAMEVNLTAPFALSRACAGHLSSSGKGCIVNVASIYGMVGPDPRLYEGTEMGCPAAYAAGKGGILQLTRYLATVLAPKVRVNAVTPGGVWRDQPREFTDRYVARTPLGRMAVEEDLKGAVAYLATDLSAYVTGHNLVVDGGWLAW